MKKKNSKFTFEEALKRFTFATSRSMHYAQVCAELAIKEFAASGNLNWCQQFYDAIPQNYGRKVAFVMWLAAHAPVKLENKRFSKDVRDEAVDLDLEGALKKPFWEFAPEKEIINFTSQDFVKNVLQLVTRHENADRMKAADEAAKAAVATIKKAAEALVKVNAA